MSELAKLPNIGKTVEEQLNQVGITTAKELEKIGEKTMLSDETKIDLKKFIWNIRNRGSISDCVTG